jgi:hypothetical protein
MHLLSDVARNYPASIIRKMFELANQYPDATKLQAVERIQHYVRTKY